MDASSTLSTTTSLEVGHYRIVRLLGRGGMGNVYLARDTRLGRLVALKFLSTELLDSADVRRQFDLEAKTTASLSHPNVVTLFDLGEQDGRPWVALEYIEGCTLGQRMNEDWPSPAETLRIGLAVAHAVAAAHAAGIVHRDLKPANVLLGVDGRPRVLDFGIARFTNRRSEPPPSEGVIPEVEFLGTPSYMAPEQWHGEDSPATDIWALGLILYQLLSHAHPFRGLDTVQIVARVGLPEPLDLAPELHAASSDLAPIVMRCLSKRPSERPTAAELCAELQALEARQRIGKPSESPFRGLLAFSERHAHNFFGRDREVSSLVERLRAQSALVVVGASGAGKSSLVLAGVVPRLKETAHYHVIVVRPQGAPLLALAEALLLPVAASGKSNNISKEADTVVDAFRARPGQPELRASTPKELAAELAVSPGRLAVLLGELSTKTESRVLLIVDQLEEVCTVAQDEAERRAFMSAVCTASGHPDEPVRVVMTVRDDFLGRIPWGPEGRAALAGIVLVSAPEPDAIREILKMPLLQTGYEFDDPALLDEIVASVRGEAACLPLLQFAMSLLWTRRDETKHLLLKEVYSSMGGVGGALATHAEDVVAALDPARIELCRQVVLRLVTGEGTRRAVERAALVEGLPAEADGLVSVLLDARLLSQQRGDDGRVELAHESLTRVWRRLARWLEESHEDLALAGDLVASSERWSRRGKRSDELWQGDALRDAARLVARGKAALPPLAISLVDASLRRERRGIRRRRVLFSALAIAALVAVTASSMAAWAWRGRQKDATVAKRRAEQASSLLLEERAIASYESGDPHAARAQLRAALEVRDSVSLRNLARKLEKEPLLALLPDEGVVYDARLLPDGRTIATANQSGIVELYDLHTLERRALRGHTDQVLGLAVLDDGRFVSASWNGEIRLWNPTTGTGEALLKRTNVTSLAVRGSMLAASRDGELVLVETGRPLRTIPIDVIQARGLAFDSANNGIFVGGDDGRVRLVDIPAGTEVRTSATGPAIGRIAIDASRKLVVVVRRNGKMTFFDRDSLKAKLEFSAHTGDARGLAVSRSGRIWSGGMDRRLVEWDAATGLALQELPTRLVGITHLALSSDERSLVASGPGGTEVWKVSAKPTPPSFFPHADAVVDLAFGPDGSRLASGSARRILVWDVASGHPTLELAREGTHGRDIAYDPNNGRMAATDERGQIALWEIPSGRSLGTMGTRSTSPFGLVYSAQYDLAAVSTNEETLLVYRLGRRELLHELRGHEADVVGVALAADGKTLYSASFDGTVRAWNLANGAGKIVYRRIGRNFGLTMSKDGKTLVVTGLEGVAIAIDVASNLAKPLGTFPGRLYRPVISPDGRTVALPSSDGNTYLVDLASGARRTFSGHNGEVNTAAFSPDGHLLATGGDDHTVRMFDTATGKALWGGGADHVAPSAELPKEPGTTYALRLGGHLVVGFDNGMVEVRPLVQTEAREAVPLRGTPAKAVTVLAPGPSSTLAAGFADGTFGVWDPETGHLLERVLLHGRVVALTQANGIVTATSELGDHTAVDLGILARDYCSLMSDLYQGLPFVWREGAVRVEAPKTRCTPP